ncbi:MAG: four helix bundle protein, partial [Candidatus Roizmanbacteria bacterium]|nr:four helix bundle protein [Candidatus Roizmanbacteria bacterium]
AYSLVLWLFPVINHIPKSHRSVLGKELEEKSLALVVAIIKANKARGQERTNVQMQISSDLDTVRILVRMTKDLKFLSIKQYVCGAEKINEIGLMLSAWMKT